MKLSLFLVSAAIAVSMNNYVVVAENNDTNAMNNDHEMGVGYVSTHISMEELNQNDECVTTGGLGVASMPSPTEAPTANHILQSDAPTPTHPHSARRGVASVKGAKTNAPTPSPTDKEPKDDKHGKKDKKGKKEKKHHKHGEAEEEEEMEDVHVEEQQSNNRPFRMNQPNKNEEEAEEEAQKKNLLNCCGIADCVGDVKDKIPFINKC